MRPRTLLLFPTVALLAYFAVRVLTSDPRVVDHTTNVVAFAIATSGCLAAALAFRRGDYLRTAWLLQGGSYGLLIVGAWIQHRGITQSVMAVRVTLVFAANVLGVVGTFFFAFTHRVAGISLPWSRRAQLVFRAAVAVLALAAAGPSLVVELPAALRGHLPAISGASSSAGDLLTMALIAPLFMTAVALRGGLLAWPWSLYTSATICWLLYDAQYSVSYFVPSLGEESLHIVTVPLRILACLLTFAAGIAQRRLSRGEGEVAPAA